MGIVPDTLILVEHDPVYTLGKNSDENHLLKSRDVHIPVYQIERGGDVTFHGPGQLVGYPILDLHHHRLSVSWYMRTLEGMLIQTLGQFGIKARRREGAHRCLGGRREDRSPGCPPFKMGFHARICSECQHRSGIF